MIVARLQGGLGNQMFQYAHARALAHARDAELKIDRDSHLPDPKRVYGLDGWNIPDNFATWADMAGVPVLRESGLPFDAGVADQAPRRCILDGYWQSERYFAGIRDLVRQDFTLRHPPSPAVIARAAEIQHCEHTAFLQIRRGDYVGCSFHNVLPLGYYARAVAIIDQRFPGVRFFVFSDDPAWCHQHLHLPYPVTVFDMATPHDDIWLMSLCHHAVIANSSFGWWGAWLGAHQRGGLIIAPQQWFHDGAPADARDIVPAGWMRL